MDPTIPIPPKPPISLNLVFLIITSISLLLSTFFIYQNWRLNQRLDALIRSQPTPTLSPTPQMNSDPALRDTANWKTYTNTKFGYSIKYPPTLTPLESTSDIYLHQATFNGPEKSYLSGIIIEVRNLTNLEDEISYRTWRVVGHITDKLDSEIPILVSSTLSKRLNYSYGQKQFGTIVIPYQKLVYSIEAESNLLDQILSTFKFVGQTQESQNTYQGKYFSISQSTKWKFVSNENQTPATPEVLETVAFTNDQAHLNIQVSTDSVEKILASQDGEIAGKVMLDNIAFTKKSGYGGIAGSVYSVSLVGSNNGKTYLVNYYTQDSQNIDNYNKDFDLLLSTFKFTR